MTTSPQWMTHRLTIEQLNLKLADDLPKGTLTWVPVLPADLLDNGDGRVVEVTKATLDHIANELTRYNQIQDDHALMGCEPGRRPVILDHGAYLDAILGYDYRELDEILKQLPPEARLGDIQEAAVRRIGEQDWLLLGLTLNPKAKELVDQKLWQYVSVRTVPWCTDQWGNEYMGLPYELSITKNPRITQARLGDFDDPTLLAELGLRLTDPGGQPMSKQTTTTAATNPASNVAPATPATPAQNPPATPTQPDLNALMLKLNDISGHTEKIDGFEARIAALESKLAATAAPEATTPAATPAQAAPVPTSTPDLAVVLNDINAKVDALQTSFNTRKTQDTLPAPAGGAEPGMEVKLTDKIEELRAQNPDMSPSELTRLAYANKRKLRSQRG